MPNLQDQLDRISEDTRRLVPPEHLEPTERAIRELFCTGMEQQIVAPGSSAPEFALKDTNGRTIRSADLLALGPLVLKFFRGRWCPYCMAELAAWRDLYPALRAKGALLLAISPQTVHQNSLLLQQHPLPFPVLSDPGSQVAASFLLTYPVPAYQQKHYRSMLVNLPFINGDASWRLSLPATYAIHPNGEILFAQAHADHRVRPDPEQLLTVL